MKIYERKKRAEIIWHSMSYDAAIRELKADKDGLDNDEAKKRLLKYGHNELPAAKEKSKMIIFLSQFLSPLIYVLLIAAVITFFLKEFSDTIVIMVAVAMNAIIGYTEESKADQALFKIRSLIKQNVKVLRKFKNEIKEVEIAASELVPGDIISLASGDKVQADARLIEANELKINEASLTGEAMPVKKDVKKLEKGVNLAERVNMCYMGTSVINGNGRAIVCESGIKTELGKIAIMVSETKDEKTPLQKQIIKFSKFLSLLVFVLCIFILSVGLFEGIDFLEIFLTSVAIAVAAIPEGLIISMTVILALGMQRILKKKALVKKLIAAETLGSASVICMDKTGTLTENKMVVSNIIVETDDKNKNNHNIEKYGIENLIKNSPNLIFALEIGMMCNDTVVENPNDDLKKWKLRGDPTETALYMAAVQAGLCKADLEKALPKVMEIPFNEENKYMATVHRKNGHYAVYIKGAPEALVDMAVKIKCGNSFMEVTDEKRHELKSQYENLSSKGLRVLAVGYKNISEFKEGEIFKNDIILVGFIGLKDPLRENAKETIASCLAAGMRPIIITGDHHLTAKAIIEEVGIKVEQENILEGDKLDKMSDEELKKIIRKISLYARVSPRHKLRIIDAWQASGEVVAMIGDGVNDAPAIKSADIGISLGSGTDVAKETADIILIDDSFGTIVDIIDEGRVIFENIRKVTLYLLSDCFTIMILITGSLILGFPLPVLPVQILWINLVTDGFPGIAMTMEPGEIEIKKERPRGKNEPLLNSEMKILIFLIGIMTDLLLFSLYFYFLNYQHLELLHLRSLFFSLLGVNTLIYVFSCRSLRKPIWKINFFSNKILLIAVLFGISMQVAAIYLLPLQKLLRTVPLGYNDWLIVLVFGIINIIAIEIGKSFFISKRKF